MTQPTPEAIEAVARALHAASLGTTIHRHGATARALLANPGPLLDGLVTAGVLTHEWALRNPAVHDTRLMDSEEAARDSAEFWDDPSIAIPVTRYVTEWRPASDQH